MVFYPTIEDCRTHRDNAHTIISSSALGSISNEECRDFISECQSLNDENYCSVDRGCLAQAVPSVASDFVVFQVFTDNECGGQTNQYVQFRLGSCIPYQQYQNLNIASGVSNDENQYFAKFSCESSDSNATVTRYSDSQCTNVTIQAQEIRQCDGTHKHYCPVEVQTPVPKKEKTSTLTVVAAVGGSLAVIIVGLLVYNHYK